uniref:UPF0505 protein C16orf62 homolog [Nasonia vitripennis] n=1 Tax=Lepeophtheirus salmonis TaxID=72036 RepID=A0A0K2UFY5_LEPSM
MLHEYDDPSFYHHKFYHLSEIIYQFGKATYSRLLGKSPGIRINFSFKDVVESAQELTRNWFAKISAIRELLPRLYLETSLLKCYRLIPEGDYSDILVRLSLSIRGVSDPLVNLYTRCFLLRVVQNLAITQSLRSQIGQLNYEEMVYLLNNTNQTLDVESLKNPIKWILEGTLRGLISDFDKDQIMLKHFQNLDIELNHSGVLLNNLIRSSSPSLVSEILLQTLIPTILECKDESFSQGNLIYSLGKSLINSPEIPFYHLHRLEILKSVWSVATTIQDIHLYLDVSIIWVEFLCINFKGSLKELNILFQDIVLHLKENSGSFFGARLKNLFQKVLKYEYFVYAFLSMAHFLPLYNFLDGDYRYQVSKLILERLFRGDGLSNEIKEFDSVANNVLLYLCQMLTDSISPFTVEDEIRQISLLVCSVCRFIDSSHKSVEKRLNFYTEIRRKFGFLDRVQYELITCVNDLAIYIHKRVDGEHTHKTKGFVQACIAFSFITIPTLKDPISKVYAFTHTAQIGLFNHCIGQADSCLRSALNLIPLMKELNETRLISCINNLLSTLILLPDSGEKGALPLDIFRFALNRISTFPSWTSKGLSMVYLNTLRILSVTIWERYPYEIKGLDSNAQLYCGNIEFIATVNCELSTVVLNHCLDLSIDEPINNEVLFELIYIILNYSDMSKGMVNLAYKLWKLTKESKEKWIIKSRKYILNNINQSILKCDNYRLFYENIVKFEN